MRVLFEVPDKWVDFNSPMGILSSTLLQELRRSLRDEVVSQIIKKLKLPKIKLTTKEIKQAVLEEVARRKVDEV